MEMDMMMLPTDMEPHIVVCPPDVVQVPPEWMQVILDLFPMIQTLWMF